MTIYCLGSINADHSYKVARLPSAGETLAAEELITGLGGKGANQSVAAARAGAQVVHLGAVGADGGWAVARLAQFGVHVSGVAEVDTPTGHAVITVAPDGENAIVIFPGANRRQDPARIAAVLGDAGPGDTLLIQNETSHQEEAARLGAARGLRVVYSAAPFDVAAVRAVLPHVSLLVLNAVEAAQLGAALGDVAVPETVVTEGKGGARWRTGDDELYQPAFPVRAVDTTGAGDCFIGSLAAALDAGAGRADALRFAAAAAALQVTRPGTADAMPGRAEIDAFLADDQDPAKGAASPQS
ncbi:ribokinase [Rhodovulum iodosum]|uniref:Ribokinase n=1 Tax=Rhodovulum iodosum TaxID=68291 RepID=A0ABV3XRP7_9RHOB|nr:ribokinase [Rhodovulum robiginosum]RSK30332.1 ribokinase [Rhodovulum robiginosum]